MSYDEPKILSSQLSQVCLMGADVGQDQLTQRNAANVQETHAASIALERDVNELSAMLARFQLGLEQSAAGGPMHQSSPAFRVA
jgi:hypothetical protein